MGTEKLKKALISTTDAETDKHSATGAASDKMSASGTACADKKRANICGKVSGVKGIADLERKLKTRFVALLLNINNAY